MKNTASLFFVLFSLSVGCFGQEPKPSPTGSISDALSKKQPFTLRAESFSIQLPEPKEYVPSKPPSEGVEGKEGQASWELTEAFVFMIFGDMTPEKLATFSPEQRLKILSDGLRTMTEKDATNITERDVTVNGFPAKEIRYTRDGKEYIGRELFAGNRLFVFLAELHHVDNAPSLVTRAFDSFEFVKNQ